MKQISISNVIGRGPYAYARFKADGLTYEFEWDKHLKGVYICRKSRKTLQYKGRKDIELIELRQEVDDRKANVIDEYVGPKGPYWVMLIRGEPHLFRFYVNGDKTAEQAIRFAVHALWSHGSECKNINLLTMKREEN